MYKCKKCGTEFEGKFCPNCGTRAANYCTNCGAPLEEGQSFCGQCGSPVNQQNRADTAKKLSFDPQKIAAKAAKYTGAVLATLYGVLMFLFLVGDFVSVTNSGVSCYDVLEDASDAPNYVITLIVFGAVIALCGAAHLAMIFKNKLDGKKSLIISVAECALILGAAITACAAAGWIHGEFTDQLNEILGGGYDYGSFIDTGAGINCAIAFGIIFFVFIGGALVADYLLSARTKTNAQPAAPAAVAEAAVADGTAENAEENTAGDTTAENTAEENSAEENDDKE